MNQQETAQLLALTALVDNRPVTDEVRRMWHALIGDLDYQACVTAMQAHYRTSEKWIMPATIRGLVEEAEADARKAPSRELVRMRQWLLDHDIDYLAYEAGDAETVAAVARIKSTEVNRR